MCEPVTKSVTPHVTKPVTVTPNVTPVTPAVTPRLVAPSKLAALEVENEALRQEVVRLKRELSEANGAKPLAMTGAERVRAYRARKIPKI